MLAELIAGNQPCVVLTGAGVSTESGIPDFRSPTGIWAEYDPYEVASIEGFRRDPARVWEFYGRRLDVLAEAQPNPAHRALAELEARGMVQAVITQNVDRLHASAGTRDLIEVHGSIATASCTTCGRREGRERIRELLPLPRCAECGTVLKPDVVMFGELLPARGDRPCSGPGAECRRCCSSSARRSRCGRSPACPRRRSCTVAASRSSTASRRRTTGAPHSCCTARPERYSRSAYGL